MPSHGLKPIENRKANYSFTRTFGSVSPINLPDYYSSDAGLGFPDQNADGFPEACTGYTQSRLCSDEDKVLYKPYFTYDKTLQIEGGTLGDPCSIYDSLKSTIVYGVQKDTESTDTEAVMHKRGQYYQIQPTLSLDWFDAIRSTLYVNRGANRSVSIGTPWFPEWNHTQRGVVLNPTTPVQGLSWHNWQVVGWKTIGGEPFLIGKTWQGTSYGDEGYAYFSRETINKVMKLDGTGAFTLAQWDGTPLTIQYGILYTLQILIGYWRRKLL